LIRLLPVRSAQPSMARVRSSLPQRFTFDGFGL
jgi:hypothetical protein